MVNNQAVFKKLSTGHFPDATKKVNIKPLEFDQFKKQIVIVIIIRTYTESQRKSQRKVSAINLQSSKLATILTTKIV